MNSISSSFDTSVLLKHTELSSQRGIQHSPSLCFQVAHEIVYLAFFLPPSKLCLQIQFSHNARICGDWKQVPQKEIESNQSDPQRSQLSFLKIQQIFNPSYNVFFVILFSIQISTQNILVFETYDTPYYAVRQKCKNTLSSESSKDTKGHIFLH